MTDDALCRPRGEAWWTRMASGGRVPTPRGFDRGHHRPSATFAHDVCNICSALESSTWQAAPFASQAPHLPRLRMIVEGLHIRRLRAGYPATHPPAPPARHHTRKVHRMSLSVAAHAIRHQYRHQAWRRLWRRRDIAALLAYIHELEHERDEALTVIDSWITTSTTNPNRTD